LFGFLEEEETRAGEEEEEREKFWVFPWLKVSLSKMNKKEMKRDARKIYGKMIKP
jgi:hypothetical protein